MEKKFGQCTVYPNEVEHRQFFEHMVPPKIGELMISDGEYSYKLAEAKELIKDLSDAVEFMTAVARLEDFALWAGRHDSPADAIASVRTFMFGEPTA